MSTSFAGKAAFVLVIFVGCLAYTKNGIYSVGTTASSCGDKTAGDVDYHVDEKCTSLPSIRPSGSYFLDDKIKGGASPEGVTPSFRVGSYFAEKVPYHMGADLSNFELIKESLRGREGQVAIDFGANQGFYTYYLAALGMQVHSFEIFDKNFRSLQHGAEFNPKEVADRVHLYSVGIGANNARFGMRGSNYEGFLTGQAGPILGATFDCFAHHRRDALDLSKGVAFVKLDVEGSEIAVLNGAKHSLFREGSTIGAMIAEIGPDRWQRAGIDFEKGLDAMKDLATHFRNSYVLVRRPEAGHEKTCPLSLADNLADKSPRTLQLVNMHRVAMSEWKDLLKTMETKGFDCNFYYRN